MFNGEVSSEKIWQSLQYFKKYFFRRRQLIKKIENLELELEENIKKSRTLQLSPLTNQLSEIYELDKQIASRFDYLKDLEEEILRLEEMKNEFKI